MCVFFNNIFPAIYNLVHNKERIVSKAIFGNLTRNNYICSFVPWNPKKKKEICLIKFLFLRIDLK